MESISKLIVFYLADELEVKDIDREIYTEDKKRFHIFFFHNMNLEKKKSDFFNKVILKEFENVEPEIIFDEKEKSVTITRKIGDVDFLKFQDATEFEYNKYLDNLNYRIKCIIQTFSLFSKLYKDKNSLFIIPYQIADQFIKEIEENKINYKPLSNDSELLTYFDVLHWTNYYSRTETININKDLIKKDNIIKVLEIID